MFLLKAGVRIKKIVGLILIIVAVVFFVILIIKWNQRLLWQQKITQIS